VHSRSCELGDGWLNSWYREIGFLPVFRQMKVWQDRACEVLRGVVCKLSNV
jgi:hypothetical protein